MKGRTSRRAATVTVCVDVVLLGCHHGRLHAVIEPAVNHSALPSATLQRNESLDEAAARIIQQATGTMPRWLEQLGAFTEAPSPVATSTMSIGFVGVLPFARAQSWKAVHVLSSGLPDRQRRILSAGIRVVQRELAMAPVAFAMLHGAFSLSELQATYETLLGRRLHKASFRRALHAAHLVVPTGAIRSEGRGRPSELYRYAPRRRKKFIRGVRFEMS